MKRLLILVIGIAVVLGGYYTYLATLETTVYVQPEPEVKETVVEDEDTIEKARKELERINAELDAKETELLEQRSQIDAELERLRETRVSFQ